MDITYSDKQGNIISTKPVGKNVLVSYNTFFKSYFIEYDGEFGHKILKLSYIQTLADNGLDFYSDTNNNGKIYFV